MITLFGNQFSMFNAEIQFQASKKARAFIEQVTAQANGWNVSAIDADNLLGSSAYLYCFDLDTSYSWFSCVSFDSFKELIHGVRANESVWPGAINALDEMITIMVCGRELEKAIASFSRNQSDDALTIGAVDLQLTDMVAVFAGTTQLIFQEGMLEPSCHFMAIRYAQSEGGNIFRSLFVPSYLADCKGPLGTAQLQDYLGQFIAKDIQEHPEWFN